MLRAKTNMNSTLRWKADDSIVFFGIVTRLSSNTNINADMKVEVKVETELDNEATTKTEVEKLIRNLKLRFDVETAFGQIEAFAVEQALNAHSAPTPVLRELVAPWALLRVAGVKADRPVDRCSAGRVGDPILWNYFVSAFTRPLVEESQGEVTLEWCSAAQPWPILWCADNTVSSWTPLNNWSSVAVSCRSLHLSTGPLSVPRLWKRWNGDPFAQTSTLNVLGLHMDGVAAPGPPGTTESMPPRRCGLATMGGFVAAEPLCTHDWLSLSYSWSCLALWGKRLDAF